MVQANDLVIDSFQYTSSIAGQAAWMDPNWGPASAAGRPVCPATIDGVSCLTLPYMFTTDTVRGIWYKNLGSIDLSVYTHLKFRMNGGATGEGFGYVSVYFLTGNGGWWGYNIDISDQWQTFVLPLADFTVAGGTPAGWADIRCVYISAWQSRQGSVWQIGTGSFAISEMRATSSTSANLLLNGGFEITNTENLPDAWGSGHWSLYHEPWVLNTDNWRSRWGVDRTISHSGTNSLRISSTADYTQLQAVATWLNVKGGQSYTLSAWLKSDQNGLPAQLTLSAPNGFWVNQNVTVDSTWRQYWVSGVPASASGQTFCVVTPSGSGTLWIDDVQLETGSTATSFQPASQDATIITPIVHRTVSAVSDYPYTPGGSSVPVVTIDSNRWFLVDGQPYIPIALGWDCKPTLPSLAILQEVARAGFNTVVLKAYPDTPDLRGILNNARTCGLKVILWPGSVTTAILGEWVSRLKDHPAIIAWYVYDEPSTAGQWQEATDKYNIAKTVDPSRPAFINGLYNQLTADWLGDILSTDYYPVPLYSPIGIAYLADILEHFAAPVGKPVWMWQQSAGYSSYLDREPTGPEAECMAYLSMIHGARGFLYFLWKSRSAELWSEIRTLTREIRTLTPVLFSIDAAPTVTADSPSIHLLSMSYEGKRYLISANTSPLPVTARITSSEADFGIADVLFENRHANVVNGTITDSFAGYQRHVYSLTKSLVGHWKLDETSGPIAMDSSGCGRDGNVVNGPVWTSGHVAGALSVDGANDYVVADDVAVNTIPGGCNTVAFWMKWNGGGNWQMPFGWNGAYDLVLASPFFGINTGQGNILGISLQGIQGQWVHVAVVFPNGVPSQSNTKIYINGIERGVTDLFNPTTASRSATSKIFISGWGLNSSYKFGGTLDDVRIYNRALSAVEVASITAPY